MTKGQRRMLKALRGLPYVTSLQVRMACIILECNGIETALEYVSGLTTAAPDQVIMPVEATEALYYEQLASGKFFVNSPGR